MICNPDIPLRALICAGLLTMVAACSETESERTPLEQAMAALSRGDGLGAEIILREQLAAGTPKTDLAAYLGEAELQQGELAEARRWLDGGDFSDETRGHGFHILGRLELREGNLPQAGKAFDQSYAVNPEDTELWVDIGRLRYRGGEQLQAVEASERAVEYEPDNPAALQFRAQLLRDAEGMHAALPWFERALAVNPDNIVLLGEYAATLGELGRASEMLAAVRRMATLEPGNRQVFYLQAVLAARSGRTDLARSLLLRSGMLDQDIPAAMLLSGVIDLQNGNYASSAQTLDLLAVKAPNNRRVRILLARALSLGGSYKELLFRFESEARLRSASPYMMTLIGRAHEALGERDQAAYYLDRAAQPLDRKLVALQGNTGVDEARTGSETGGGDTLSLVRGLIVGGQRKQAVVETRGLTNRFAGSADAFSLAGDALLADGDPIAALRDYRKAAQVRRPWLLTRRMVAALRMSGQSDQIMTLLETHLRGEPMNAAAAVMLARQAIDGGDWPRAAALIDHAIANGGKHDPELLGLRAQIAMRLNDSEGATLAARQAYDLQRMNGQATSILAKAMHDASGNAADVLLAKADRLDPNR